MRRKDLFIRKGEDPSVNLTPLIDVVFVILIIFILVAPLLHIDQIELPKAAKNSTDCALEKDGSCINIYVYRDNSIRLDKDVLDFSSLQERLKEKKSKDPSLRLQLFHDQYAYFGTFQKIKNILEELGFEEVDVVLLPA